MRIMSSWYARMPECTITNVTRGVVYSALGRQISEALGAPSEDEKEGHQFEQEKASEPACETLVEIHQEPDQPLG